MCRYILPLPADTITPVQQGIFVTCDLCQIQSHTKHTRLRTTLKAKDLDCKAKTKDLMHQGQGQGQGFWLKDQGQGLTSLDFGFPQLIHRPENCSGFSQSSLYIMFSASSGTYYMASHNFQTPERGPIFIIFFHCSIQRGSVEEAGIKTATSP